jgi:hypothetical protein
MTTTKQVNEQSGATGKPPVAKIRIGLLTATIWERITDNGAFYSATFERRYRDANGDWHGTQSFDKSNLLTLAKLADQADTEIARLSAILKEDQAD